MPNIDDNSKPMIIPGLSNEEAMQMMRRMVDAAEADEAAEKAADEDEEEDDRFNSLEELYGRDAAKDIYGLELDVEDLTKENEELHGKVSTLLSFSEGLMAGADSVRAEKDRLNEQVSSLNFLMEEALKGANMVRMENDRLQQQLSLTESALDTALEALNEARSLLEIAKDAWEGEEDSRFYTDISLFLQVHRPEEPTA